eukprot:4649330-Pyramimonas_sp.AAC.1
MQRLGSVRSASSARDWSSTEYASRPPPPSGGRVTWAAVATATGMTPSGWPSSSPSSRRLASGWQLCRGRRLAGR